MGSTSQTRRFRTNPVEIAIFAVVTILFGHSVWRLFHESANYKPNALTAMSSNPLTEGRAPASARTGDAATGATGAMNAFTQLMGATAPQAPAAAAQSPLLSIDFRCKEMTAAETGAQKIRLTGASCAPMVAQTSTVSKGSQDAEDSEESGSHAASTRQPASVTATAAESVSTADSAELLPTETRIFNQANRFAATVFQDPSTRKFTTDYIPLVAGANPIRIQFIYKGGRSYSQDFVVTRQ